MIRITREHVLLLHDALVKLFGGAVEIRDEGLLDSALSAPFQSFAGQDLYPDVVEKAAALCRGIVNNHPIYDGNKRTGAPPILISQIKNPAL